MSMLSMITRESLVDKKIEQWEDNTVKEVVLDLESNNPGLGIKSPGLVSSEFYCFIYTMDTLMRK